MAAVEMGLGLFPTEPPRRIVEGAQLAEALGYSPLSPLLTRTAKACQTVAHEYCDLISHTSMPMAVPSLRPSRPPQRPKFTPAPAGPIAISPNIWVACTPS